MSSEEFPKHLIELLKTSKYLHLATASKELVPSCSMMHYLYLSKSKSFAKDEETDLIILATPKDTGKYQNMVENPNVALLIHDWVTAKKISLSKNSTSEVNLTGSVKHTHQEKPAPHHGNRLLSLLQEMNQSELSQMSATLNGKAYILDSTKHPEEYEYYKSHLLKDDPDAHAFIETGDVAIIKVKVTQVKISDNENNTKTI